MIKWIIEETVASIREYVIAIAGRLVTMQVAVYAHCRNEFKWKEAFTAMENVLSW